MLTFIYGSFFYFDFIILCYTNGTPYNISIIFYSIMFLMAGYHNDYYNDKKDK